MATLSLPGLTIGLLIWLFSTFVIQNTMIREQSSQQLYDTRVTPQPSTSSVSPSPPSSSLNEAGKEKNQVTKKEKKGKEKKEKKKKEPKSKRGNHASSSEIHTWHRPDLNLHVSFAKGTTIIEIVLVSLGS